MIRNLQFLLVILIGVAAIEKAHSSSIILDWQPSASSTVAGYDVYFGTTSGSYPYKVDAGKTTSVTISNLTPGVVYYLAATAYNAQGTQSALSQEIAFVVPYTLALSRSDAPSSPATLQFPVAAGHWCEIQATTNLKDWTTIGHTSVTMATTTTQFTDPNAGSFGTRFYRLIVH